jgi:hypothetical protein
VWAGAARDRAWAAPVRVRLLGWPGTVGPGEGSRGGLVTTFLDVALGYASLGWAVFPCRPRPAGLSLRLPEAGG